MRGLVSTEAGWWFMVAADDAHQTVALVVDRQGLWPTQKVTLTAAEAALLGEALGRAGERELRARHSG